MNAEVGRMIILRRKKIINKCVKGKRYLSDSTNFSMMEDNRQFT